MRIQALPGVQRKRHRKIQAYVIWGSNEMGKSDDIHDCPFVLRYVQYHAQDHVVWDHSTLSFM